MDAAAFATAFVAKTYEERLQVVADLGDALRGLRQIVTDAEATKKFVTASGATWTTPTKSAFIEQISDEPGTQPAPTVYSIAEDFFEVAEGI